MLDSNTYRIILGIGSVVILGICINMIVTNWDQITEIIDAYLVNRLREY